MLHWAPSPVGQLRDAATSLITAGTDAQSGICCALVLSCAAVTQSSFVDTSCASCCVPPPPLSPPLTSADRCSWGKVSRCQGWVDFFCTTAQSGGILRVAQQRDSAVSDYNPCAVEPPPAQSALLLGAETAHTVGTKEPQQSKQRVFPQLKWGYFFSSPSSYSLVHLRSSVSAGPDSQLCSVLDERELGTSLGENHNRFLKPFLYLFQFLFSQLFNISPLLARFFLHNLRIHRQLESF